MAELYRGTIVSEQSGGYALWDVVITGTDGTDNYIVSYSATLRVTASFSLDLIQKDIWLTQRIDGSSHEIKRWYISQGQFQTIPIGTVCSNTLSKTYAKTPSAQNKQINFAVDGSATVYTNMFGFKDKTISFTIPSGHTCPSNLTFNSYSSTTSTIDVDMNWNDGTDPGSYVNVTVGGVTKRTDGENLSFTGLTPNTNYLISAQLICTRDGNVGGPSTMYRYTYPELYVPTLSLVGGQEHDAVLVTANSKNGGNQYRFRINGGGWSAWQESNAYAFSGLVQMTNYTIGTQMQNTISGFASAETAASITTWYDPLTNLAVILVDRWYWYIAISSSYTYSGTISKYEFSIGGDQPYINTGTNSHSRGTKTENAGTNLQPHTAHTCTVRLTDNHGRAYAVAANFNTLDDRVATIIEPDGSSTFVQAFVIEPDGSTKQITPDIHGIIESDGSTTILPNNY